LFFVGLDSVVKLIDFRLNAQPMIRYERIPNRLGNQGEDQHKQPEHQKCGEMRAAITPPVAVRAVGSYNRTVELLCSLEPIGWVMEPRIPRRQFTQAAAGALGALGLGAHAIGAEADVKT